MPLSPQSLEEKPYNLCLNCAHIGKNCDGPNFLAMTTERWCEWCRNRKDYLGWTNAKVADLADVSKISVDRIMSGNVKDLRISTMQAITKALVNGSWGKHPCAIVELSAEKEIVYVDNPELVKKCERLKAALENANAERKAEIMEATSSERRKIDFLKEQISSRDKLLQERYEFLAKKDKTIKMLGVLLAIAVITIIAILI